MASNQRPYGCFLWQVVLETWMFLVQQERSPNPARKFRDRMQMCNYVHEGFSGPEKPLGLSLSVTVNRQPRSALFAIETSFFLLVRLWH
jgi:hypothetical protein